LGRVELGFFLLLILLLLLLFDSRLVLGLFGLGGFLFPLLLTFLELPGVTNMALARLVRFRRPTHDLEIISPETGSLCRFSD
jgi:hypothetical protein